MRFIVFRSGILLAKIKMRKEYDIMGGKVLDLPSDALRKSETKGENRAFSLVVKLQESGRSDEIAHAREDRAFREKLYKEFGI